jgi:hypothetical protein
LLKETASKQIYIKSHSKIWLLFAFRLGQAPALEFMQWLGLDLSPDNSVEDLLRGRSAATDLGPSSVDWFLNTDSWTQDAIACQIMDQYTVDDKMKILLKKLDTNAIEQILGYKFRQKSFIIQAMTHSSYSGNKLTDSYERLEVSI